MIHIHMDWVAAGAMATAGTGVVALLSVGILAWQIRLLRLATTAQSYATLLDQIQAEPIRAARAAIFRLKDKPLGEWTELEIGEAEKVCNTYDTMAIMLRHDMLPKGILIDNWRDSVVKCWVAAKPLVLSYRETRGSEYWDDFEWLADQAGRRKR
jgi:hypothetical protein